MTAEWRGCGATPAVYSLRWIFRSLPRSAAEYAHGVNRVWLTEDIPGPRLRAVRYDDRSVGLRISVVADDLARALDLARMLAFGLIERAPLPLPTAVTVLGDAT